MRNLTFKVFGELGRKVWIKDLGVTVTRMPTIADPFPTARADWETRMRMREAQEARCACCGQEGLKLYLDHDHQTGVVRGLVCQSCNVRLGFIERRGEDLEPFSSYLRRTSK